MLTLRLAGRIGPEQIQVLQDQVAEAALAQEPELEVDLTAVTVLGTRTLSLLCGALRSAASAGCRPQVAVVGASEPVRQLLVLCEIAGVTVLSSEDQTVLEREPSPVYGAHAGPGETLDRVRTS